MSDPTTSVTLAAVARSDLRAVVAAIPHEPGAAAIFVFRLLALLPPPVWPVLARQVHAEFAGSSDPDLVASIERLALTSGPQLGNSVQLRLASAIFTAAALPPLSPSEAERVRTTLNVRPGDVPSYPELERFDLLRGLGLEHADRLPPTPPLRGQALPAAAQPQRRPSTQGTGPARTEAVSIHQHREQPRSDAMHEGAPVASGGVVLLGQFLMHLFDTRGIAVVASSRIATADLPRACALVHYAATGRQNGHEFELGFIKVLLGLTPETPVPFSGGLLEPGDADEVDGLLASVVDQWRALRNMSPDNLRLSFLQRQGLLSDESDGWRLRVDASPIDLLLGDLPWTVDTIELPWMAKAIRIDWVR